VSVMVGSQLGPRTAFVRQPVTTNP
jgi:hypothetical protein